MTQSTTKSDAPSVIPGQSIGLIRIGMSRADFKRLGLDLKPHPSGQFGDAVGVVDAYHIVFESDRVVSVALKLKDTRSGITIAGQLVGPGATFDQIAKLLPNCGDVEVREGGTVVACGGGTTLVKCGAEDSSVEIQVVAPGFGGG